MQSKRVLLHSRVNWSLKHFQHLGFQHLRFEFECPETFFGDHFHQNKFLWHNQHKREMINWKEKISSFSTF